MNSAFRCQIASGLANAALLSLLKMLVHDHCLFETTMKISVSFLVVCCATGLSVGCRSSEPDAQTGSNSGATASNGNAAVAVGQSGEKTAPPPISQNRRPNERWADENGVEYLGNVPLDVFFDQPLEVASNATPMGGTAVATLPAMDTGAEQPTQQQPDPAMNSDAAVADGTAATENWAELLPAKNLLDEVNQIRSFLNSSLQSVGSYNNAMLSIPGKAAALAALAHVASKHPEEISWKEDAAYIRNLAKLMTESDLQRGKKDQSRLLLLFENIVDILNRSRPAGLEEPSPDDSYSDVAEMRLLMMRMAEAERRMKNEAGSESAFINRKELVQHEAMMMASLTKIISMEEYGYGDDPEFVGYARKVMDACETIQNSAGTGTFSSYDLALSRISTNCNECHSAYKNN